MSYRNNRARGGARGRGSGGNRRGRGRGGAVSREPGGIFTSPDQATTIDDRLAENDQNTLVNSFKSVALQPSDLPLRPGWGTAGRSIKMRSNFFAVKMPFGTLYEYDVKITPSVTTRRVKRRIFQLLEEVPQYAEYKLGVAHDFGAKLIAVRKLPQPLSFPIAYYDEDESGLQQETKTYAVEFIFIQDLDLSVLSEYLAGDLQYRDYDIGSLVAVLNIVLSQYPSRNGVMVGRNRFFFPQDVFRLGGGLEAWKGFYSSVRPTYKQLMVNVNVATTAFYQEGNLADSIQAFQEATFGARITSFVCGVRVELLHLQKRRKTVRKASRYTARTYRFTWNEANEQVTVEDYFRRHYNITLQHPDLRLIDLGGNANKPILVPAEVCRILPGQPWRGKLTDDHTAAMILHACKPPNVNAQSIVGRGLEKLGFKGTEAPSLPAFEVTISGQMTVAPARILSPPRIMYSQQTKEIEPNASWNLRGVRFSRGATLDKWAVLLIRDGNRKDFAGVDDPQLKTTVDGFIKMCETSGMTVPEEPKYAAVQLPRENREDPTRKTAIITIRSVIEGLKPEVDLILVVLSNGDKHIYSGLKFLCDVSLDIHTVCVHGEKFRQNQKQYFANVALKVNAKLGGVNHSLEGEAMDWLNEETTMLVGMDVTHPGPGSLKGTPSIAAVVASVDESFAQFPASLALQEPRQEMIEGLKGLMIERLDAFEARRETLPQRIIVYRDGVSEGQYRTVVDKEMPKIIDSFKKYDTAQARYRPKLSIIICGKRHHTRFYPLEAEDADKLGNPQPGTVVDQGVTGIYAFDFFLQAHGGLQGTTRPTHYLVVHDEINFDADMLQRLTNDMSYMFARATKAVSLVSPAYYADLACDRARCYIHDLPQESETTTAGSDNDSQVMRSAENLWGDGVRGRLLRESMFYL